MYLVTLTAAHTDTRYVVVAAAVAVDSKMASLPNPDEVSPGILVSRILRLPGICVSRIQGPRGPQDLRIFSGKREADTDSHKCVCHLVMGQHRLMGSVILILDTV